MGQLFYMIEKHNEIRGCELLNHIYARGSNRLGGKATQDKIKLVLTSYRLVGHPRANGGIGYDRWSAYFYNLF